MENPRRRPTATACVGLVGWLLLKLLLSLSSNAPAALIVGLVLSATLGADVATLWSAIAAKPR